MCSVDSVDGGLHPTVQWSRAGPGNVSRETLLWRNKGQKQSRLLGLGVGVYGWRGCSESQEAEAELEGAFQGSRGGRVSADETKQQGLESLWALAWGGERWLNPSSVAWDLASVRGTAVLSAFQRILLCTGQCASFHRWFNSLSKSQAGVVAPARHPSTRENEAGESQV